MSGVDETKTALQKAAAIIARLERQLAAATRAKHEPIAIVGTGCRLPGGVTDLASFWRLLENGVDTAEPFRSGRFDLSELCPRPPAPPEPCVESASFLAQVDEFDAAFWGIAPREANWIDPQHRLLLECAWEAIENAGIPAQRLRGSRVGVFIGTGNNDYGARVAFEQSDALDVFSARLGSSFCAGRLSFLLGLQGPTVAVETACSSALTALHLACRALRAEECEMALVGAVQILASSEPFVALSGFGALSRDGRCKSFSARADGYGRAEGGGVLVLKRLSDAERAGDRVLALIRGSAVNHDGQRSALTTPNAEGQRAVLRQALADARLAPAEVDYVEAHAVGTLLGDAIEVEAIADVYGPGRGSALPIGCVKANIGHLEPASGMAGVLKAIAALRYGALPPSLHAEPLNEQIDWNALPLRVVRGLEPWPRGQRPRRAGVSSFGLSGTNAHVILEEPELVPAGQLPAARGAELVVLSAKSAPALSAAAARLRRHVIEQPEAALGDLAFSLATTRSVLDHRAALIVPTREALLSALAEVAGGKAPARGILGRRGPAAPKLGWLFSGAFGRIAGAGQELARDWPVFRASLEAACEAINPLLAAPLLDVLWGAPGSPAAVRASEPEFAVPALFSLEWALTALWRSWGLQPDRVTGYATGEVAAACVAGLFSLDDAARLVCAQARLLQALPACESAAVIDASERSVVERFTGHSPEVFVAAALGPARVVIAGSERSVSATVDDLSARGVTTERLHTGLSDPAQPNQALPDHTFLDHGAPAESQRRELARVVASIRYRAPAIGIASSLTGTLAGPQMASPAYWDKQHAGTLRFGQAIDALRGAGANAWLGVGPRAASAVLDVEPPAILPAHRVGLGDSAAFLDALGALFVQGATLELGAAFAAGARRVELPTYAWQRQRHWIDT